MKQVFVALAMLALALAGGTLSPAAAMEQSDEQTFSRSECRWAVRWINGPLETLMAHGIIKTISSAKSTFEVHAGDAWLELSFWQAGEILRNFSRARQITGHSPFFTVEQGSTGTVLGRVTQSSVTVLLPGEGYFEYFPDMRDRENTRY